MRGRSDQRRARHNHYRSCGHPGYVRPAGEHRTAGGSPTSPEHSPPRRGGVLRAVGRALRAGRTPTRRRGSGVLRTDPPRARPLDRQPSPRSVPTLISRAQSEWIEAEHELCARAEGTRPPARRVRAGPARPAPVSMAWPHRATRCDPGRTDAALRRGTGQHQGSASLPSLLRRSPFSVSALELRRRSGLDPEA
jgi:hypothetical protein